MVKKLLLYRLSSFALVVSLFLFSCHAANSIQYSEAETPTAKITGVAFFSVDYPTEHPLFTEIPVKVSIKPAQKGSKMIIRARILNDGIKWKSGKRKIIVEGPIELTDIHTFEFTVKLTKKGRMFMAIDVIIEQNGKIISNSQSIYFNGGGRLN
ncbi:MAG: hypothetical protein ABUK01_01555 [Leptospirales bacterium]